MDASLLILTGDAQEVSWPLTRGRRLTVGRHRSNDLVLRDEHCSRQHAVFYDKDGQWVVQDLESQNGTYVDGAKVTLAPLYDGQEIRIGQVRMRFVLNQAPSPGRTAELPVSPEEADTPPPTSAAALLNETRFQADEFSALCRFMADAVDESDAGRVVRLALETVQELTRADVVGFLGLNETGDVLPRLVLPDVSKVDWPLSKSLTRRVERERRPVWLGRDRELPASESLMSFTDAVCVPLLGTGDLLGALHAYRRGQPFTAQHVRVCEIVGRHLASNLRLLRMRKQLEAENTRLRRHAPVADTLVGISPAIARVRQLIQRVAPQSSTVLIRGESGVGKELVAQALHQQSPRRHGPLVVINCAAIPTNLMESQLFGHKKGAFTGADADHEGFFQQADGGTLFLDEIGELSLECQAKLLRVLEGQPFTPLGGKAEIVVDVRFRAATNRRLEDEVKAKRFREDLYYRLRVIEIFIPPLREHPEDIPLLVEHFLDRLTAKCRRRLRITPAALARLQACPWPGNVRQLQYVLESAAVLAEGDVIDAGDLRLHGEPAAANPPCLNLQELERWAIMEALRRTGNNVKEAAGLLGIARSTFYSKAEKYGLKLDQ